MHNLALLYVLRAGATGVALLFGEFAYLVEVLLGCVLYHAPSSKTAVYLTLQPVQNAKAGTIDGLLCSKRNMIIQHPTME